MDIKDLLDLPPWDWPPETGKKLLKALTDRGTKPSDRLVAAELAGDLVVINDSLAAALLNVIQNPADSEELRAMCAIALGPVLEQADMDEFEDPDDVPISRETFDAIQLTLQKVFDDQTQPKEVRRRVLEASVRAPQDWHAGAIRTAYSSGDSEWMLTAVFAMRWIRGFDAQILAALKNPDPDIQYEALEAAGEWELQGAWPYAAALLRARDTEKRLLLAAIAAASCIRPKEAVPLLEPLAGSKDEEIEEAVSEALLMAEGGIGDDEDDDKPGNGWVN